MGTLTQTDCAYMILSLNPSSFRYVPNNLASHALVILPSHIVRSSAFLGINTIKTAVTCTHIGRRDMVADV